MGRGLQLSSGRVIALGRLLLALLFVLLTSFDVWRAVQYPTQNLALLLAYATFAATVALLIWNNWWLDAHLAGPAHAVDIALFTTLVYLTDGDNNPFFNFSVLIFLSAAIRWGWRATALTALLLTLLFIIAGWEQAAPQLRFQFSDFIAGAGQLTILSLILIWFGVNRWRAGVRDTAWDVLADLSVELPPLETGLQAAMAGTGAAHGAFVWSRKPTRSATVLVSNGEAISESELDAKVIAPLARGPFLYDLGNSRALERDEKGNLRAFAPADHVSRGTALELQLHEGLAIPIHTDRGQGQIFLEKVNGLSIDHIELGEDISIAVASHIERRALMRTAEENAEARSRLAIARDLHDSVVQFLAGAAFRLEAIKRSQASGREITPELNELKELMLLEQGELRSFITALRSGSQIDFAELAEGLQSLAGRLSRQWDVRCTFSAEPLRMTVPARLHLDTQQLVREAIANAVRHAGAKNVGIRIDGDEGQLTLELVNDGASYPNTKGQGRMPDSLRERVEAAGGKIDLSRGMGVTRISIALPITGDSA